MSSGSLKRDPSFSSSPATSSGNVIARFVSTMFQGSWFDRGRHSRFLQPHVLPDQTVDACRSSHPRVAEATSRRPYYAIIRQRNKSTRHAILLEGTVVVEDLVRQPISPEVTHDAAELHSSIDTAIPVGNPHWKKEWGPIPHLSHVTPLSNGPPTQLDVLNYLNDRFGRDREAFRKALDILFPPPDDDSTPQGMGVPVFQRVLRTARWRRDNPDWEGGIVRDSSVSWPSASASEEEDKDNSKSITKKIPTEFFFSADELRDIQERIMRGLVGLCTEDHTSRATQTEPSLSDSPFSESSSSSSDPSSPSSSCKRSREADDQDSNSTPSSDESDRPPIRRRPNTLPRASSHASAQYQLASASPVRRKPAHRGFRKNGHGRPSVSFTSPNADARRTSPNALTTRSPARQATGTPEISNCPRPMSEPSSSAGEDAEEDSSRGQPVSRKRSRDGDEEGDGESGVLGDDERDEDGEQRKKRSKKH